MLILKLKFIFTCVLLFQILVSNGKSTRKNFTSQQKNPISSRTIPENYHFSYPVKVLLILLSISKTRVNIQKIIFCYYISFFNKASWFAAYQQCKLNNMELVSLPDAAKKLEVETYLKTFYVTTHFDSEENQIWTSATDFGTEREFIWMANGKNVLIDSWIDTLTVNHSTRIHSVDRDCLSVYFVNETLRFNEYFCKSNAYFLCERVECIFEIFN